MSAIQVVILIVSAIAGAVANAKQSGELPKAWVPYAAFVGTFLVAFGADLSTAAAAGVALSWALLGQAALQGAYAVVATVVGITAHQHFTVANDNAAPSPAAADKKAA